MNETSVKQDSKEVPNPTLFGLPKPLVGALIGILLLLSITLPFEFMPTNTNVPAKLAIIAFGFQFWGILPAMLSNGIVRVLGFNLPALANTFIVVVASCIPPALLGWMIASYKSSTKVLGIILLVIYIIISQIFGFAMARLTI